MLLSGCSKPSLITVPIKAPEPIEYSEEFQRELAEDILDNKGPLDSEALQEIIVDYDQFRILVRQHNVNMERIRGK